MKVLGDLFVNNNGWFDCHGNEIHEDVIQFSNDKDFGDLGYLPPTVTRKPNGFAVRTGHTNWPLLSVILTGQNAVLTINPEVFIKSTPKDSDLSHAGILSAIFFQGSIDGAWLFKNTFVLNPNMHYEFSQSSGKIELTSSEQVDQHDYGLAQMVKNEGLAEAFLSFVKNRLLLIKKNGRTVALGVSGGLDSRLALSLAKSVGLQLNCFYIGRKVGRFGLLTNDYMSAKALAERYGFPLTVFDPREIRLDERILSDIMLMPMTGAEFSRFTKCPPNFGEILLNGGWGFWVQKQRLDPHEKLGSFILLCKSFYCIRPKFDKALKVFSRLTSRDDPKSLPFPEKMLSDATIITESVGKFISKNRMTDRSQIIDCWTQQVLGGRISSGMFESFGNQMRPSSIYAEFFGNLHPNQRGGVIHVDRVFLQEIVRQISPELLQIRGQGGRVFADASFINRFKVIVRQILAGHGVMNYGDDIKSRYFKSEVARLVEKGNEISSFLDISEIYQNTLSGRISTNVISNIVKYSRLIEMVRKHDEN